MNRTFDVLIAGAGPAGLSTALNVLRRNPRFAGRIVAIEKSAHPRLKVCAGGLIPRAITSLEELGLELTVPAVQVFGGTARTSAGVINLHGSREPLCTIIRRDQFDDSLARAAREAGLEIIEKSKVLGVETRADSVSLITDRGSFAGRVLVGADGSGSRVRDSIFGRRKCNIGRALMADVAVDPATTSEFAERLYRFDFDCVAAGVQGYSWAFPCIVGGQPSLNLGIYDQHPRKANGEAGQPDLLAQLRAAFPESERALAAKSFKAFPIRWYDNQDKYVSGRTILCGDAAGVDPLMGEGISCALEHGKLAAEAVSRYLDGDDRALDNYGRQLHGGVMGRKLRRLAFAARRFYGPRHRAYFRLAILSRSAQKVGVDWYNGAHQTDEISIARAMFRVIRGARTGSPRGWDDSINLRQ